MLPCLNNKMKVRKDIDYKSVALPVELQGHRLFCRINSLFNQVIQYKINLYLARMLRMLAAFMDQSILFVTDLSVYESVWKSYPSQDFSNLFNFIKTSQIMEWKKYESNQVRKQK